MARLMRSKKIWENILGGGGRGSQCKVRNGLWAFDERKSLCHVKNRWERGRHGGAYKGQIMSCKEGSD